MSPYPLVALLLLAYAAFCYYWWWRFQRRQARLAAGFDAPVDGKTWLVAYASQTGNAEHLAAQTAAQLQQAGWPVQLLPLNQLTVAQLQACAGALFVVSTYGEGEAPDNGNRFMVRLEADFVDSLQYAVLALGDRSYPAFCAFGHALHLALQQRNAVALCDLVEVDQRDAGALRHWQYYLGQLTGQHNVADWFPVTYQPWQLHRRVCLNPASPGRPAFHLQLRPEQSQWLSWQAGDIVEVGPGNSARRLEQFWQQCNNPRLLAQRRQLDLLLQRKLLPAGPVDLAVDNLDSWLAALPDLPHREYSIASLPDSGCLDLLVRQVRDEQGETGLGSGWLTEHTAPGDKVLLRVRSNSRFHPPATATPMILIGNGTGMAGLRAHLLHRVAQQQRDNWLLFGERTRAHDVFFAGDILAWQASGFLPHLDLAFSRESDGSARYVQDLVRQQAAQIREWVEQRAAVIYICGSLQGMAQGVEAELEAALGKQALADLAEAGRYCRDVY